HGCHRHGRRRHVCHRYDGRGIGGRHGYGHPRRPGPDEHRLTKVASVRLEPDALPAGPRVARASTPPGVPACAIASTEDGMGWRSKICRIAGAATLIAYSATAGMAQDALPDPAPQQKLSESILERSLSAAAIIETADVRDADDDAVGKVEDFIVGPDGRIESMIIATDELLGLGESYFTYPLKDADINAYREIRIKADADEIERLQKAEPVPEPAGNDSWRLSELIGDIARTRDNKEYG